MRAREHGAGYELDAGQSSRGCAHQLGRHSFVAAANHDNGIHGLSANHFLCVHGHEVAQVHAGRLGKTLPDGDRWEIHGQTACEHDAPLDRFDQLRHVAMTGVVAAACICNANDRPVQRTVCVASTFDKSFS